MYIVFTGENLKTLSKENQCGKMRKTYPPKKSLFFIVIVTTSSVQVACKYENKLLKYNVLNYSRSEAMIFISTIDYYHHHYQFITSRTT